MKLGGCNSEGSPLPRSASARELTERFPGALAGGLHGLCVPKGPCSSMLTQGSM